MVRGLRIPVAAATLLLAAAPAAVADTARSSNWGGYAAHRSGLHFRSVSAQWTQPAASCTRGQSTFSAIWVGLGGYSASSSALEQIGTEVDCDSSGQIASSAWYELVPAASRTIGMPVAPGDQVKATVTVKGHVVLVSLTDLSSGRSFSKRVHDSSVDTSSAEWIVEAPSDCGSGSCQTLPLANFGSATFDAASARTTRGHSGSISDSRWRTTRILLVPHGRQFVALGGGSAAGEAIPGGLTAGGGSFMVSYSAVLTAARRFATPRRPRSLVHR